MSIKYQLVQSRRGGKIHRAHCGARSIYAAAIEGTENMTDKEIRKKYGQDLCGICFPEAPAQEKGTTCQGSGTRDWKNGKEFPEYWDLEVGKGGRCAHCNKLVATVSNDDPTMREHRA